MTDQEIYFLRSKYWTLENQTRELESVRSLLQSRLTEVKATLSQDCDAKSSSTSNCCRDANAEFLLNFRQNYVKKLETAATLFKLRLERQLSCALQHQKEELRENFRSDFLTLMLKNNQLAAQLSYTTKELQAKERKTISAKQRSAQHAASQQRHKSISSKLKKRFERLTAKLIKELKDRQETIEKLQRYATSQSRQENIKSPTNQDKSTKFQGPIRCKIPKGSRSFCRPYPRSFKEALRSAKNDTKSVEMNEPAVSSQHSENRTFHSLPHNFNFYPHYVPCGGSGLETLEEASSEEESLTRVKDDAFPEGISGSETSFTRQVALDFTLKGNNKVKRKPGFDEFTTRECEADAHKMFLLESIIQQLRDELRESKDQNELLEFRLLEIEEAHSNNKQKETKKPKTETSSQSTSSSSSNVISDLPLPDDIMRGRNEHIAVTESRSSCSSDCSESLSLQESGIFDGQGSDDGLHSPRSGRSHISRELANLTFEIEELLRRYNEGSESRQEKKLDPLERSKVDLASDLSYCRQRIQEFEKRLSQMNDITYMRSLEDKVNLLLVENKRLEEERSEMEEAENDNRYLCQRLQEKVGQLKKKKAGFQVQLNQERAKIMQLQYQNENIFAKVSELEGLLQNSEQRNFELEESSMEMRCSVQFMTNAIPALTFLHLYNYWSHWNKKYSTLLPRKSHTALGWHTRPIVECKPKARRKHKLSEILEVEPIQKKCKGLKEIMGGNVDFEDNLWKWNNFMIKTEKTDAQVVGWISRGGCDAGAQTGEDLWKIFVQEMVRENHSEYETKEDLCQKIDALELNINRMREAFATEKSHLIEMYEDKLGEKDMELKENRQCQEEKEELQDKWNRLLEQLEQFALYCGTCLYESTESVSELGKKNQLELFSNPSSIQAEVSEFSTAVKGADDASATELPSSLKDCLGKFEWREPLLSEIDRLMSQVKRNPKQEQESNLVTHLLEENQRLQALFIDHDKLWNDFKRVQEENEGIRSEVRETRGLRRKLEETQRTEAELRERLEELERAESSLRNQLALMERKEQKGAEKIQQLRDEIQFLRSKCCQLQDDVDAKATRETKYKADIHSLATKLRENTLELEEKESQLETNETALQTQISKLKTQLQELYQNFTDTECSNGMLREEVSYLEKTVEETVGKAVKSESTIIFLSQELKQKDSCIEELQSQIRQMKIADSQPLSLESLHELSDFDNCEGGLHGVVRAVHKVVGLVKNCKQCETVCTKLMEIADTLIPLIQILKSSQTTDYSEPEAGMKRCESDEILVTVTPMVSGDYVEKEVAHHNKTTQAPKPVVEEDEILITRLQNTMTRLTLQISKLEESLNLREAEMKESHVMETGLWKYRCEEKNLLIQLLARRIAYLSSSDIDGHFINGILTEVKKLEEEFAKKSNAPEPQLKSMQQSSQRRKSWFPQDFSFTTIRSFLTSERRRILELLESVSSGTMEEESGVGDNHVSNDTESGVCFRVVRTIGTDALLVSWSVPGGRAQDNSSSGYEIAVNGSTFLKIPKPNRHKAVLFGLNLEEPLRLTFSCPGDPSVETSTITYIS